MSFTYRQQSLLWRDNTNFTLQKKDFPEMIAHVLITKKQSFLRRDRTCFTHHLQQSIPWSDKAHVSLTNNKVFPREITCVPICPLTHNTFTRTGYCTLSLSLKYIQWNNSTLSRTIENVWCWITQGFIFRGVVIKSLDIRLWCTHNKKARALL